MGHTEMLLAVAGLSKIAVNERIQRLAAADWASLSVVERTAFRFAHMQATDPASIGDQDVRSLVHTFGPDRALDVIWWTCRCHYMTCISDAFQLQLERRNVFDGFLTDVDDAENGPLPPP